MRETIDNTKELPDYSEGKTFLCEYKYKGATWAFEVKAESWKDAEQRLSQLSKGKVLGEVQAIIPAPGVGWLVKLWTWLANI